MSDPRGLCGATRVLASGGRVGPCVLPAHDGPVHQDAGGRRWAGDVGARPPGTDLRAKIAEALAPFCLVHTVQTEPCRTCAQRLDAVMAVVRPALDEAADPRRIRDAFAPVLTSWQGEHDLYRERADRKGYSSDELAAELLEAAIESVTEILTALDQTQGGPVTAPCSHAKAVPVESGGQIVAGLCPDCDVQLPAAWFTCDHADTVEIPAHEESPPYTQICNGCGATFREDQ